MTKYIPLNLELSEVKLYLNYNPSTGVFLWIKSPCYRIKPGTIAGTLDINGYYKIGFKRGRYLLHRLAYFYMTGKNPEIVDHINRNTQDNRWDNLRESNISENQANSSKHKDNKSGFKGVVKNPKSVGYYAQITKNKQVIYLGCFPTAEEAHAAYCKAALKLHGKFARFS